MQSFPANLLDQIRAHLEDEKKRVVSRIAELTAQDPFSDSDRLLDNAASDREASEESNHDRYTALVEELQLQLTALDDALVRAGNGTYGYCTNCQEMIDTDRLSILPTATLCLSCEQKKK